MRYGLGGIVLLLAGACSGSIESKHQTHNVVISQMKFNPSELLVNLHDTIVFTNKDIVSHDVTEANRKWTSNVLANGMSWRLVIKEEADFYCTIHPMMRGKVQVVKR
jgi:plastocyanin